MTKGEKISQGMKKKWADPNFRKRVLSGMKTKIVKYGPSEKEKKAKDPFKQLRKIGKMLGASEIVVSMNGGGVTFK